MSGTSSNWPSFGGQRLTEIIDQLYAARLDKAVSEWDAAMTRSGRHFRPAADLVREIIGARQWSLFSPATQAAHFLPDPAIWDMSPYPREVRAEIEILESDRGRFFGEAIFPVVAALIEGEIELEGIEEPEHEHRWSHNKVPAGLLRYGRWVLYRNGDRLVSLDPAGNEIGPAYAIVRLFTPGAAGPPQERPAIYDEPLKGRRAVLYLEHVNAHIAQHGRRPTAHEDEMWGKNNALTRDRIRTLRREHGPPDAKRGGRPPSRNLAV